MDIKRQLPASLAELETNSLRGRSVLGQFPATVDANLDRAVFLFELKDFGS
jgi:hypothetical protein